ncbi:MAG: Hpt domain-containing protein, partial [Synergistaceae bacterium]|nr:Hpt domain-containing protein [Synergistaceae bacterium]
MNNVRQRFFELFIFETKNYLDELERILLASQEGERLSHDDVNNIFRIMHTIKGTAATMEYGLLSSLAHKIEDIFSELRDDENAQ